MLTATNTGTKYVGLTNAHNTKREQIRTDCLGNTIRVQPDNDNSGRTKNAHNVVRHESDNGRNELVKRRKRSKTAATFKAGAQIFVIKHYTLYVLRPIF